VRRRAALVAALAVLVAGCGSPPADLFVAHRTGTVPGANLEMLVSDGSVRCNGGPEHEISSEQILEGRAIAAALENVKQSDIPPAKPVIFGYTVRSEWGTIRFADTAARPTVLPRITRLVRDLAIGVCHLQR
jgi:hypothetical protein